MLNWQYKRILNEINNLVFLKEILDEERKLKLKLNINFRDITKTNIDIQIINLEGLINNPNFYRTNYKSSNFNVFLRIPIDYPMGAIPIFVFYKPIPFHPHIWNNGNICWGTGNKPQPEMLLVDWIKKLIELINWKSEWINPNSPANIEALNWWKLNNNRLNKYINQIDFERLELLVNRSKGLTNL